MAIQSLVIILLVLLAFLALGVPIVYSIGISALVVILQTVPLDVSVVTAAQRTFVGMSKFSLTAIPFFILAGNLMNQGGIAKRLSLASFRALYLLQMPAQTPCSEPSPVPLPPLRPP